MQKNSILIQELTLEEIHGLFSELTKQIKEIKQNFQPIQPPEYYTRNELAKLLKCDLSTVHNWTVKGILTPYGIEGRVYYKRSEVEAALIAIGKRKGDTHE